MTNPDDPLWPVRWQAAAWRWAAVSLVKALAVWPGAALTGVRSSPSICMASRTRGHSDAWSDHAGRASIAVAGASLLGLKMPFRIRLASGAMVNTARNRAVTEANQAIYREVGGPGINGVGEEALIGLNAAKSRAYDDALRGVASGK